MSQPIAVYGMKVPCGDVLVPVDNGDDAWMGASLHITMAAIDPTAAPQADEEGNIPSVPRSTLKIIRTKSCALEGADTVYEYLQGRLANGYHTSSEETEENSDDEPNGGPSDPSKSKKAKDAAALEKLMAAAQSQDDSDESMDDAVGKPNGILIKKGKEPATSSDDDDSEDEDVHMSELVLCTLDTERTYQQRLDIKLGLGEKIFFAATGTHDMHVTGNYLFDLNCLPIKENDSDEDEVSTDEMCSTAVGESEDDELDTIEDPCYQEIESDQETAPKLVSIKSETKSPKSGTTKSAIKADTKANNKSDTKGNTEIDAKNGDSDKLKTNKSKRPAEEGLDELMDKAEDSDKTQLSKKQLKKLKNNQGKAAKPVDNQPLDATSKTATEVTPKSDKKVQFAKNLEQGPTGSASKAKAQAPTVKVVNGVTIDDRKLGTGRQVQKGSKIGVRYIGKLENGKVFDSNKKGKPFTFTAGNKDVIPGWEIGVLGMAVGGERRLTVPPHLAYGSKGVPGIPPNSTLQFDVKLIDIK